MAVSLGEKLRQAREAKGLDLRDVADNTRIALNYLEAIEADNYKPLPGGIFNKGFVRSFAKAVGVDEKEALADYTNLMARQGASVSDEDNLPRRPQVLTSDRQSSPFGKIILALIFLALAGVGIYYGVQYVQQQALNAPPQTAPSPSPENAFNPPPSPAPPSVADGLKVQVKTNTQTVNITPTIDGRAQQAINLAPGETREFTAQNSLKFRYYKSFGNEVQMTLNGRPLTLPTQPANPKLNGIDVEINKENYTQFLK
jgi:cytoskeleton protein RodZ